MASGSARLKAKVGPLRRTRSTTFDQPEYNFEGEMSASSFQEHIGETEFYEVILGAVKQEANIKQEISDHTYEDHSDINFLSMIQEAESHQSHGSEDSCSSSKSCSLQDNLEIDDPSVTHKVSKGKKRHKHEVSNVQASLQNSLKLRIMSRYSSICKMRLPQAIKCNICNHYFPTEELLKEHSAKHTVSDTFRCAECSKTFAKQKQLIQHLKYHSGETSFLCGVCNLRFVSKKILMSHEKSHKYEDSVCETYGKNLKSNSQLQKHVEAIYKRQGFYTCPVCGKSVKGHKGHALAHLRIHLNEKQFKCNICGMRFIQSSQLTVHMRTHTGAKPFSCPICNVSMAYSSAIRIHMRVHTREKPVKCQLCPAAFSQLPHLKKHMRCIHKSEKPYVCVPCMTFFQTKMELTDHINSIGCPQVYPPTCESYVSEDNGDKTDMDEPAAEVSQH